MQAYLLIVGGLALLGAGGEFFVRGAVQIAERFGVSPLLIGFTLVGLGTSTPELATSVQASLAGSPGIAVGNIVEVKAPSAVVAEISARGTGPGEAG